MSKRNIRDWSIRWKLLLPILLILISLFSIRQILVQRDVNRKLSTELELRLQNSNELVHNLIDTLFSTSLKNYLRGRVEDAMYSFEAVFNAYKRGSIPLETAMKNLIQGLKTRKVGPTGYFFVMDSDGIVIFHPYEEYIGQDFSNYDFIQKQLELQEGFIEYEWSNPEEKENRAKGMYTKYFEPMDWLIAATAYSEEFDDIIDFNELREQIFTQNEGSDYHLIMDSKGNFLLHPLYSGQNLFDIPTLTDLYPIITNYNNGISTEGSIDYYTDSDDSKHPLLQRLYYSWIEQFDWVIASSFSVKHFYKPLQDLNRLLLFYDTSFILLISFILFILTQTLFKPLSNFTSQLLKSEVFKNSKITIDGDEVQIAKKAFNYYIKQLTIEKQNLKIAAEENILLAEFPNKIQLPVIRIDDNYICRFMNENAESQLDVFEVGSSIENHINRKNFINNEENEKFELNIIGQLYRIYVTSIPGSTERYLHFYNLTSEKRLNTLQSIWHHVFDSSIEGITITDENGIVERINNSFTQITGYSGNEIIGKPTSLLKSDKHNKDFYENMWKMLITQGHWEGEIWNRKKSGEIYPEWLSISAFIDSQTGTQKYMAIFHDISELFEKTQELEFAVSHDILTKLPNRNLFNDRLLQIISSAKRSNDMCAVIILDIYQFNRINENLGMSVGDKILVAISELLKETLREGDTVARLGSDHFGLLLTHLTQENQSMEIISRLQELLNKTIRIDRNTIRPVINMGISMFPHDGNTAELLINNANTALHKSKQQKPGMFTFFDSNYNKELSTLFELEESLKNALENQEFLLYYQPKVQLASGELSGFEALIRWNKNNKELVSPDSFIPILEENGMIVETGAWIISEVCHFINKLSKIYTKPFKVGINISAKQFTDPLFLDTLKSIIADHKIDPGYIDLEITENIAATGIDNVQEILVQLHDSGFSISIDDFGTGYSSLKYFKDLQFNTLKIDKSFVDPLPADTQSLSIVKSIIQLARNLGKEIVVEGVETKEQADLFKELKCEIMQGYYFSKPLPEQDAISLAKSMDSGHKRKL